MRRLLEISVFSLVALGAAEASAITRSEIVSRAQQWVDVGLLYCVAPNNAYDSTCGYTCKRTENPEWDPYRSDCSGLVSWAWGLPPPGPSTAGFAPYSGGNSYKINPADLQPGDALNDRDDYNGKFHHHIMLFAGWAQPGVAKIIQESSCGKPASSTTKNVQIVGDRLQVGTYLYHAIRYEGVTGDCKAHCEGSKIHDVNCNVGDCGAYGATCTDDALGVRCVYTQCPATGTAEVCLDQDHIATCVDGLPKPPGDCSAYAAYCSLAGGKAHCASHFCAKPTETPIAHTGCFIDGSIKHCDDKGVMTTDPCPAGTKCSVFPSPHCEANTGCPATGDVRLCLDGRAVRCYEGTLAEVIDCSGKGLECAVSDGIANCVEDHSGDDPGAGGSPAAGSGGAPATGGSGPAGAPAAGAPAAGGPAAGTGGLATGGKPSEAGAGGKASGGMSQGGGPLVAGQGGKGGSAGKGPSTGGTGAGGTGAGGTDRVELGSDSDTESGCSTSGGSSPAGPGGLLLALSLAAAGLRRGRRSS